jgi:tetratricopeptide (TPR) repeat protein
MERRIGLLAIIFSISVRAAAAAQANDSDGCRNAVVDPNPDRIITACTALIEKQPGTGEKLAVTLNTRGNAYYDKGLSDQAIQDFDQAIKLDPNYAEAFYDRGSAYFQKGDYDRALQEYNEAIRLKPDYVDAYNNRGDVYYQKGDIDHALEDVGQAIKLSPNQATSVFNRAMLYFIKGDCSHAMEDFARANSLNPKYDVPESAMKVCAVPQ